MNRRDFLRVTGLTPGALCLHPAAGLLAGPTDPDPRGRRPFSFLVLGDLHFARPEFYNETAADYARKMCAQTADAWDALWDEVRGQLGDLEPRPSFVLQLGDYVHGDCPTPEQSRAMFGAFARDMAARALTVPLMLARGNHDVQGKDVRAAYDAHMPAFLKEHAPPSAGRAHYAFDAGPAARVVVLDVYGRSNRDARLDATQLRWLDDDLTAYRRRSPDGLLFLATHAPVFPMTPRGAVFDTDPAAHADLVARLVRHRVTAVLCGHLHLHASLTYTDPGSGHRVAQLMTYAMPPRKEQPAAELSTPAYEPGIIADVNYRRPEELRGMRRVVEAVAPAVSGYRYGSVPGYQVVRVGTDGAVEVRSYRGLGRRAFETLTLPRA